MHNHSENLTKYKSEACLNFWQPLVKKIYACNTDGIFPGKDGVCVAFIRLQKAWPNAGFQISYKQESRGYRECDKTQAICISKSFERRGSICLTVNCEAEFLSIHFEYADALVRTVLISINDEYTVEMDFNTQNYLERIPALQGILKQTENFLKEIPFPITIQLQEKS
jgi:hypothetical protein